MWEHNGLDDVTAAKIMISGPQWGPGYTYKLLNSLFTFCMHDPFSFKSSFILPQIRIHNQKKQDMEEANVLLFNVKCLSSSDG
jgi:hypothetical protein